MPPRRPARDGGGLNAQLPGEVRRNAAPTRHIFGQCHVEIVRLSHSDGKPDCAMGARDSDGMGCDFPRMRKAHPKRPHLLAWRLHFGKSQEWLAEQIGTHHATVLRQEKGAAGVDDQTFAAIARAYGISVEELSAPPSEASKARAVGRLMRAIRELDERGLSTLAGLAEQLSGR